MIRALGGLLYLLGMFVLTFNVYMTIKGKGEARSVTEDEPIARKPDPASGLTPNYVAGE